MAADGTRVLVTGAGGFVMSVFIADLLVRDPAAGVTALDAAPLDAAAKAHFARFGDRITFLQCDVRDREALQLEIGKVRPTDSGQRRDRDARSGMGIRTSASLH